MDLVYVHWFVSFRAVIIEGTAISLLESERKIVGVSYKGKQDGRIKVHAS